MVRISTGSNPAAAEMAYGVNGNGRTGSPSEVFSPNIMEMEKQQKRRSSWVLCFVP